MSNETCDNEGFVMENIVIYSFNDVKVFELVNVDKMRDKLPVVRFRDNMLVEVTRHNVFVGTLSPCIKHT